MTDTTTDQLRAQVAGVELDLMAINAGDWPHDLDAGDYDEGTSPLDAWLEGVLEVTVLGRRPVGGEWVATGVEVLVCCGGPDVRVTFDESGEAHVVGRWGGDMVRGWVYVPSMTADLFDRLGVEL